MTPRVLIVDDDPLVRDLLQAYLSREGYDVHCADTAERAEALLGSQDVDLVLLDIRLPGKDGLTLTRELRVRWRLASSSSPGAMTISTASLAWNAAQMTT